MAQEQLIHGIIAYPITPFGEAGVDIDRLAGLVDTMVDAGVHAIAPLGSTGESAYLSFAEWKTVVDATVAAVAGRVPVVVGSSDLTTAGTVARAEYSQQAGATAVMVIPVSYWALNEREIVQHYTSVSDAISIPIMAYNNPATSGIDMSPTLLNHMFESITNVKMVKESTGDIQRMLDLKQLSSGELPFYNGSNPLVLKALLAGASGWCTAAPCLRPAPVIALYEAVAAGDTDRALRRSTRSFCRCSASSSPRVCPRRSSQGSTSSASRPAFRGCRCFRWMPRTAPSWSRSSHTSDRKQR